MLLGSLWSTQLHICLFPAWPNWVWRWGTAGCGEWSTWLGVFRFAGIQEQSILDALLSQFSYFRIFMTWLVTIQNIYNFGFINCRDVVYRTLNFKSVWTPIAFVKRCISKNVYLLCHHLEAHTLCFASSPQWESLDSFGVLAFLQISWELCTSTSTQNIRRCKWFGNYFFSYDARSCPLSRYRL